MAAEVLTVRVIAGEAKGRRLQAPRGLDVRPATDRLKEALFNVLFDVADDRVLDLFAGTASLAIEAVSRGAEHATAVDSLPAAAAAMRANVAACGFADRVEIVQQDVAEFVESAEAGTSPAGIPDSGWNLVFIDPPYAVSSSYLERLATGLSALAATGMLTPDTRLTFERRTGDPPPPLPDGFAFRLQRRYGQTSLYLAGADPTAR